MSNGQEPLRPDPRAHRKAQPSLFDIKQVPVAEEHRYPRGYTPERMAEVRGATEGKIDIPRYAEVEPERKIPCPTCAGQGHSPTFKIQPFMLNDPEMAEHWRNRGIVHNGVIATAPGQKCWTCQGKGKISAELESARGMGQNVDHPFYQPHGERLVQEGIARSTVPVQHLEGLQSIELTSERKFGLRGMVGTQGLYTKNKIRLFPQPAATPKRGRFAGRRVMEPMSQRQPMGVQLGVVRAPKVTQAGMLPVESQRQKAEATLIHEIGHHVSGGTAGAEEEAAADRYMVEHWRPDPRVVRQGKGLTVERTTYLNRLGGPYTSEQWEQTAVPTPRPKRGRRRKS